MVEAPRVLAESEGVQAVHGGAEKPRISRGSCLQRETAWKLRRPTENSRSVLKAGLGISRSPRGSGCPETEAEFFQQPTSIAELSNCLV